MQFCYGATWQYKYNLGDTLKWEEAINVGDPTIPDAIVHGLSHLDNCPLCDVAFEADYDIIVTDNILCSIRPVESYDRYYEHEGDYYYP
jgi:hypothetical protein